MEEKSDGSKTNRSKSRNNTDIKQVIADYSACNTLAPPRTHASTCRHAHTPIQHPVNCTFRSTVLSQSLEFTRDLIMSK